MLDHQIPVALGRPSRFGHEPCDRIGRRRRRQLGRPALGSRQCLSRIAVHRIGRQQATQPVGRFVVSTAARGDFRQDLERQDVLRVERQNLAKHCGGPGVVLLIDQVAPEDDVRADVVGVPLETGGAQLDGPI